MSAKYRNVLCVYPHGEGTPEKKYAPPIGLEYIATAMEDLVEKVTVVDMRFEPDLAPFLEKGVVDMVCLSSNWDYQWDCTLDAISKLPDDVCVVLGGRHATMDVEEYLTAAPKLDFIVRGDGEETIRDLVSGQDPKTIDGISFRDGDGFVHNKNRDLKPLSTTRYPNRKLRRVDYRFIYRGVDLGMEIDFVSTSRGCPFKCKFCSFNNNPLGQKRQWTARSPQSVIDEIKEVDARFVFFVDDNFAVDPKRVDQICDLIIAEGIDKTFAVALRIDIYKHPETVAKMYEAGFRVLGLGIESAQDKTLKSMQKGFDTATAKKALAVLRQHNFYLHGYFMVGCIGENEEEMEAIGPYARSLGLHTIDLIQLRTDKFSPLNELVANTEGYYINQDNLIYSDAYSAKDLRAIRHRIRKRYYSTWTVLRIAWIMFRARIMRLSYVINLFARIFTRKGLRSSSPLPRHVRRPDAPR